MFIRLLVLLSFASALSSCGKGLPTNPSSGNGGSGGSGGSGTPTFCNGFSVCITDFATAGGLPTANGIDFNLIWAAGATAQLSVATLGSSSADCSLAVEDSHYAIDYYMPGGTKTATAWIPSTGGVVGPSTVSKCVRFCSDAACSGSVSNWIYNSGN